MPNNTPPRPIAERFWEKVDRSGGPDTCWPFGGARDKKGYGRFLTGSKKDGTKNNTPAHRVAWVLTYGPLVASKPQVLHRCDNPPCCNPKHLFVGTNADNVKDMNAKGRARFTPCPGERNASAKLTEAQVLEIRDRFARGGLTQKALGAEYGVSEYAVFAIVRGKTWTHVRRAS